MKKNYNYLLLSLLFLINCATGIRSALFENMSERSIKATKPIGNSVYVDFVEGADRDIILTNIEITRALRESLLESKFFNKLSNISGEDFDVKAIVQKIEAPSFGSDFNITIDIKYIVYKKNQILKEITISKSGLATLSEEFVGIKRISLAYERTIKNNIKEFMIELNKMN
jgi:hypothetical protein